MSYRQFPCNPHPLFPAVNALLTLVWFCREGTHIDTSLLTKLHTSLCSLSFYSRCVLVSLGHHNKTPDTEGLKQHYFSQFWRLKCELRVVVRPLSLACRWLPFWCGFTWPLCVRACVRVCTGKGGERESTLWYLDSDKGTNSIMRAPPS